MKRNPTINKKLQARKMDKSLEQTLHERESVIHRK